MIKKIVMLLACVAAVSAAQSQQFESVDSILKKQTRRQKYDRGLAFDTKTPSIPKGLWIGGLNISYSQHHNDDYRILIVSNLNSRGNMLTLSPMAHYVFANNQSIGVRFLYKRLWQTLDSVSLELGDITDGDSMVGPYDYNSHNYMGFFSYRYYVGFGANKRFLFFNEVQAGIGGGQQREQSGKNEAGNGYKTGTWQNSFSLRLGLSPGMIAFITNELAVEVQIGLFGYEFKKMNLKYTSDETDSGYDYGSRRTSSISTKFDFLSIAFGMTFYL